MIISNVFRTDVQFPELRLFRLFFNLNQHKTTQDMIEYDDSVYIMIFNVSRKVLVLTKRFRPGE